MLYNYLNRPRRKAWIGAAIGAAVSIGSAIFGASKQKKAQEQQLALQRNTEARNVGVQGATNLTQAFSNYDELDKEFQSRFKRYGGRQKAEGGIKWTEGDTSALIGSLGSAGSNIATAMIGNAVQKGFNPTAIDTTKRDVNNENIYDSANRSELLNDYYRTAMLRCGGMGKRMRTR